MLLGVHIASGMFWRAGDWDKDDIDRDELAELQAMLEPDNCDLTNHGNIDEPRGIAEGTFAAFARVVHSSTGENSRLRVFGVTYKQTDNAKRFPNI